MILLIYILSMLSSCYLRQAAALKRIWYWWHASASSLSASHGCILNFRTAMLRSFHTSSFSPLLGCCSFYFRYLYIDFFYLFIYQLSFRQPHYFTTTPRRHFWKTVFDYLISSREEHYFSENFRFYGVLATNTMHFSFHFVTALLDWGLFEAHDDTVFSPLIYEIATIIFFDILICD